MLHNECFRRPRLAAAIVAAAAVLSLAACQSQPTWNWPWNNAAAPTSAMTAPMRLSLTGASEVPPVATNATGSGTITVNADRTLRGSVTVTGMTPTAAHIHVGAAGANGPVIIPLTKSGDTTFNVPTDAKLTDAQWADFKAGKLYVNVHSAANPNGEIRAQLQAG